MENQKLIFGPVLSRRLGYSLGIDLIPSKICNQDCIYCEVGKTTCLTEERQAFVSFDQIVKELKANSHEIDYITITGSGEPTLHTGLDQLIKKLKEAFDNPIAMITNSLLLRYQNVREELTGLDIIIPSLDAISKDVFQKINHPAVDFSMDEVVKGLADFNQKFSGKMWLEVLLCKGINDSAEEISKLKEAVHRIKPDKVQLNTVSRPPGVGLHSINPLSVDRLNKISKLFAFDNIEVLNITPQKDQGINLNEQELLAYLKRRPGSFEELNLLFKEDTNTIRKMLVKMEQENSIEKFVHQHEVFFRIKDMRILISDR